MRGLWTQASRPRLRGSSSHHLAASDSFAATLVRKTTTRPPRRRPRFAEHVFTVLLTPVLAAALFVDTSWKAKQRRDWDDNLAAINEEINQLKERELRLRSSIQLRNIHHGLRQQRRGYATAAHAVVEVEDDEIPSKIEIPSWEEDVALEHDRSVNEKSPIRQVLSAKEFSPEQLANFQRYHRLNAITLALRMLLHLRTGPNSFYTMAGEDDPVDIVNLETLDVSNAASLPTDTNRIVQMLALTRKQMRSLHNLEDLFYAAPHIQAAAKRGTLHRAIQELTADFDSGNVSLPGLVDGYGKAILQSKDVPCLSVYVLLIRSLSRVGSYSLAYHAAAALKSSTLPLSDPAIFYMLLQIGRACDSRSFNNLTHHIANRENPMNLMHLWEKTRINGLDLPVPTTLNPRLLMALVYVALRCAQPERAEAWLSLLREADYGSMWKDDVFRSFLAYYSQHGNWDEGKKWIQRSVNHAYSIAKRSVERLARVIYRMLDLCVRCRKLPEYTAILDAAVNAGIGPPSIDRSQNDRRNFHPRTRSILLEWESLPLPDSAEEHSVEDKSRSFQYACKSLFEELSPMPRATKLEQDNDNDFIRTASTATYPHQHYAVRSREQHSESDEVTARAAEELNQLQSKVAKQERLISEMKTSLELSVRRQQSYQEEAAARTQRWTQRATQLGEDVQVTLKQLEKLKAGSAEQDATFLELKNRTAFSARRQQKEAEWAQSRTDGTVPIRMQLQEVKGGFIKQNRLSKMHSLARARTRQEIKDLKAGINDLLPKSNDRMVGRTKQARQEDMQQGSSEDTDAPIQYKIRLHPVRTQQDNPQTSQFATTPPPLQSITSTPQVLRPTPKESHRVVSVQMLYPISDTATSPSENYNHTDASGANVMTQIFRRDAHSVDRRFCLKAVERLAKKPDCRRMRHAQRTKKLRLNQKVGVSGIGG